MCFFGNSGGGAMPPPMAPPAPVVTPPPDPIQKETKIDLSPDPKKKKVSRDTLRIQKADPGLTTGGAVGSGLSIPKE